MEGKSCLEKSCKEAKLFLREVVPLERHEVLRQSEAKGAQWIYDSLKKFFFFFSNIHKKCDTSAWGKGGIKLAFMIEKYSRNNKIEIYWGWRRKFIDSRWREWWSGRCLCGSSATVLTALQSRVVCAPWCDSFDKFMNSFLSSIYSPH